MKLLSMRLIAPLAALLIAAGCATGPEPPPAEAPWTPSELVFELSGRDPIEGFNRSMFAVTDFTDTIMVKMFVRNDQLADILAKKHII